MGPWMNVVKTQKQTALWPFTEILQIVVLLFLPHSSTADNWREGKEGERNPSVVPKRTRRDGVYSQERFGPTYRYCELLNTVWSPLSCL